MYFLKDPFSGSGATPLYLRRILCLIFAQMRTCNDISRQCEAHLIGMQSTATCKLMHQD